MRLVVVKISMSELIDALLVIATIVAPEIGLVADAVETATAVEGLVDMVGSSVAESAAASPLDAFLSVYGDTTEARAAFAESQVGRSSAAQTLGTQVGKAAGVVSTVAEVAGFVSSSNSAEKVGSGEIPVTSLPSNTPVEYVPGCPSKPVVTQPPKNSFVYNSNGGFDPAGTEVRSTYWNEFGGNKFRSTRADYMRQTQVEKLLKLLKVAAPEPKQKKKKKKKKPKPKTKLNKVHITIS